MDISSVRLLMAFINTNMTIQEFLEKNSKFLNEILRNSKKSRYEDLEGSAKHEKAHADVYLKYGIKCNYFKDKDGYFFTVPDSDTFMQHIQKLQKEKFIEFFKEVVCAPKEKSMELDGTDELFFKILNKEIKNDEELTVYRLSKITQKT